MIGTVVVTGGRGAVGRHVVDGLVAAAHRVRVVTRDRSATTTHPKMEVVTGDLDQPVTLATAFDGAERLVLIAWPDTVDAVVARARAAGISHVVVVSSAAVTAGYDTTWHLPVEQAVRASGLDWSIVRPGEFALNTLSIWGAIDPAAPHRGRALPGPDRSPRSTSSMSPTSSSPTWWIRRGGGGSTRLSGPTR
jgi:uncharacterized protein YbjT (DUF2867 family)